MEIKVKHILVIVLIIILGAISFIVISIKNSQNIVIKETKEYEINENKIGFNSYEDIENLIMQVAIKDGNWSNLLLTDNFKSKYNEKDGVLGKLQFDKIEYKPYNDGRYPFEERTYFVITQGLKKAVYTFNLIGKNGYLDDIKYFEIFELTDENGQELDAKVIINVNNFARIFYMLSSGGNDEKSVAVTDNFHRKYPYFLDLFIHYSPLEFNEIRFNGGNFENKVVYFIVDSMLECVKREYEVKFEIDDRGYLDDAEATCIKIEHYERESLEYPWGAQVFFKNGNWKNLKITEKFKNRYNPNDGCFFDIDSIDVNLWVRDSESIDLYTDICDYAYKDGAHKWFCKKQHNDKNGYLDDIEFIPINYTGIDAKKAKDIYLKEHNG